MTGSAQNRLTNYLRGLFSGYFVVLATIVVGLWLTPFTLRYLSREEFAIFTLANDVLMWLGLLEIGLATVLNVKAAQLSGRPDSQHLNRMASTTFFSQCAISLLVVLIGAGVVLGFPAFFALQPALRVEATVVMALMVAASALTIVAQTFSALLIAHQQIHVDNGVRLALICVRTLVTVVLLVKGIGLVSLAIAHLCAVVLTGLMACWRVRRLLPGLELAWRHFSLEILRQTGGTGVWFSIGGMAGILVMHLDRIVTARMLSVEMVTTLALTGRMYALAWTLLQQFVNTARPALAQMIGEGRMDVVLYNYRQMIVLSSGGAVVMLSALWAGNGLFVHWWVGAVNYGGWRLDALLALNVLFHVWILPNRALLVSGLASIPQTNISRFIEGGGNLALAIILGWFWGVEGIVASTALACLLTTSWYFPLLSSRFLEVRPAQLLAGIPGRMALLAAASLLTAGFSRPLGEHIGGLAGAAVAATLVGVAGGGVFLAFVVDNKLRQRLFHLLRSRLPRWCGP